MFFRWGEVFALFALASDSVYLIKPSFGAPFFYAAPSSVKESTHPPYMVSGDDLHKFLKYNENAEWVGDLR